jgi:phage gp29-like protein
MSSRKPTSPIRNRGEKPVTVSTGSGGRTYEQRLAAYRRYRENDNPLRGLTLRRAIRLVEDYFKGDMADLQWTYFHIEGSDPDMIALIELSLSRLAEMDWDVVSSEEAEEKIAETQKTYVRERLDAIDNLEDAIEHFALARFCGYSHVEPIFTDGICTHWEIVDQWNVVRDGLKGSWKWNPDAQSVGFDALPAEYVFPPERFIIREVARPVNRFALFKAIRANLSDRDWDAFAEIFNIPSGVVIGPPNVPQGKEAEYESSAKTIAEGGSGYLPNGSTYVQNKAPTGSAPFKDRLDHLSEKLVLAGTGGMLSMLTDATGLGSGASDAHTKAFDSIASAEAMRISTLINRQFVKALLEEKFPGQKQVAYFRLAANEETDSSKIIADVKTLSDAGFELDEAEVSEKTGWKVKRKAAPAPPAPAEIDPATGKPITNRALADAGRDATFAAIARADLQAADLVDQAPILKRLAELDAAPDDASWLRLARQLDADWADLLADWVKAGGKAEVFQQIFGTALVSGAVEGAQARAEQSPAKPLKNRQGVSTPVRRAKTRQL